MFYYSDSLFQITVNPIVGADVWVNSNGSFSHWWNGVEAWSYAGGSVSGLPCRDNHESMELTDRDFQNQRIGGPISKIRRREQGLLRSFAGGSPMAGNGATWD